MDNDIKVQLTPTELVDEPRRGSFIIFILVLSGFSWFLGYRTGSGNTLLSSVV